MIYCIYSYLPISFHPHRVPLPSPVPVFAYLFLTTINTFTNLLNIIVYPDIFKSRFTHLTTEANLLKEFGIFSLIPPPTPIFHPRMGIQVHKLLVFLYFAFSPFSVIPYQFFEIIIHSCKCLVRLTIHSIVY